MAFNVTGGAEAVDALISDVETRFGPVAILVNNAGITRDQLLMRMKDEGLGRYHGHQPQVGVPLVQSGAARHDEGAQWPHHQYRLGGGVSGNAGQCNYAAAKAAIIGFPNRWRWKSAAAASPSTAWRRALSTPT